MSLPLRRTWIRSSCTAVTLKVSVIDRNGDRASGSSSIDLVNTDTSKGERRAVAGKDQTYTIRPGRYFVSSWVPTPTPGAASPSAPQSLAYLARPEVTIDKDASIVLETRGTPEEAADEVLGYLRREGYLE